MEEKPDDNNQEQQESGSVSQGEFQKRIKEQKWNKNEVKTMKPEAVEKWAVEYADDILSVKEAFENERNEDFEIRKGMLKEAMVNAFKEGVAVSKEYFITEIKQLRQSAKIVAQRRVEG